MTLPAGSVVDVDWPYDAPPKEPNKTRPAIVVQDSGLFEDDFPNVVVVACTRHLDFVVPSLCIRIEPDKMNGLDDVSYAAGHQVTVVSKERLGKLRGIVPSETLAAIRATIAETLGLAMQTDDGAIVIPFTGT